MGVRKGDVHFPEEPSGHSQVEYPHLGAGRHCYITHYSHYHKQPNLYFCLFNLQIICFLRLSANRFYSGFSESFSFPWQKLHLYRNACNVFFSPRLKYPCTFHAFYLWVQDWTSFQCAHSYLSLFVNKHIKRYPYQLNLL